MSVPARLVRSSNPAKNSAVGTSAGAPAQRQILSFGSRGLNGHQEDVNKLALSATNNHVSDNEGVDDLLDLVLSLFDCHLTHHLEIVNLPPAHEAIFMSLRKAFDNCPLAVTEKLLSEINVEKNPRHTFATLDNAEYWVKEDNTILRLRIPGRLDLKSDASKIGPYFDAWNEKNKKAYLASEGAFKKVKAQFVVQAFPSGDNKAACPYVPDEVADISSNTKVFLAYLAQCCDERKDKGVPSKKQPTKYPFVREGADDTFAFYIKSDNLFKPSEDVCKASVPELANTLPSELFSTCSDWIRSLSSRKHPTASGEKNKAIYDTPSKLRKYLNSRSPSPIKGAATNEIPLSELGDPGGTYAQLIEKSRSLKDATVVCPNVRDADGKLIPPTEYARRLHHLAPVTVDVTLKLWEISPDASSPNGKRIYSLSLNCLQLHPCTVTGGLGMFISDSIIDKGKKRMAGVLDDPFAEEPTTPTRAGKRAAGVFGSKSGIKLEDNA